ncbi:MAG: aspartate aminotransferase family protein [Dehalococcoidia bacterium]|nr:aspartate aminotransferase family protein [Dehalococcoidia bacterium]
MRRQMDALVQNPTGWPASPPQIQLAEKIAGLTPEPLQCTIFSTNGTDANETAIKIARQYWKLLGKAGKHKVIGRARNYHGMSLSTLAAGGNLSRRKYQEPLPPGFGHISTPDCYRCRYPEEHPGCGPRYADELRLVLAFENADTVACVMMEQTLGGGGCLVPPKGYMEEIRRICDEHEVLLVLNEVITGFGWTGT